MDISDLISKGGGVSRLAAALGVRHPAVSAWLKAGCIPGSRLAQISIALGVPAGELIPLVAPPPAAAGRRHAKQQRTAPTPFRALVRDESVSHLTLRQLAVMEALAGDLAGASTQPLADALGISNPAVSLSLSRLGGLGLTQRDRRDRDRRYVRCSLTAAGRAAWERVARGFAP